jgi:hypothetical protein
MISLWVHEYQTSLEPPECTRRLSDLPPTLGTVVVVRTCGADASKDSLTLVGSGWYRRYSELSVEIEAAGQPTMVKLNARLNSNRVVFALIWTTIVLPFTVITHDVVGKVIFTAIWLTPLLVILPITLWDIQAAERRIVTVLSATPRSPT